MDNNPHAHEAENEQGPPRFATGGNATQLRRRSQYNMPHQLHRLAMQPQTESASNLLRRKAVAAVADALKWTIDSALAS